MKTPRLLLSALLGALLAPALSEACVCAVPKPLCQEYWETPVVFAGLVLEESSWESGDEYVVRFQIDEAFRGVPGSEIVLRTPESTCTMPFDRGERYLVFAYRDEVTGNIEVETCSYTAPLDEPDSQDALNYIRGLKDAKGGGRIFGRVQLSCPVGEECTGLPAVTVEATAADEVLTTSSGTDGSYAIPSVPRAKYRVTAQLSPPLTSRAHKIEIFDGSCAELDFNADANGIIRGRAVDEGGKPVPHAHVELLLTGRGGAGDEVIHGDQTDLEGEFELLAPAAGRYLTAVNASVLPDLRSPYPTTYYPGVADRKDAIALEVGEGQVLSNVEIRVPVRLPEVPIEVEVRWPDGRPARDAAVAVWPRNETDSNLWRQRPTDQEGRAVLTLLGGERYRIGAGASLPDGGGWGCARAVSIDTSRPVEPLILVLAEEVVVWPLEGRCEEKHPRW